MMNKIIIIIVFLNILNVQIGNGELQCPSCEQSSVCISSLKQDECEDDEFLDPKGWCNCCPGCVTGSAPGKSCDNNSNMPKCAPGLKCTFRQCVLDKESCLYLYHLDQDLKWMPICTQDGKFPAKICKGDRMSGRCFCLNEKGDRIFGYDWWKDADNMECKCSRQRYKLEIEDKRTDVTLHCAQNGNYEPLQCDSGVCWCANEKTGQILPNTTAVPDGLWTFLPCYNETIMGTKYLRQCESASYAQGVMRKVLLSRGTRDVAFNNIVCDYDGSHGIFFIKDGIAACQWRDGSRIGSYQVPSNQVSQMNCNCARDQKIFAEIGLTNTLTCSGNGNYYNLQNTNGKTFCVDRDGYAVTEYNKVIEEHECVNHYYYT